MARPMIADGRGHDVVPASEEELLDELRRLDGEFWAEREPRIAVIYADPEADVTPKLSIGLGADQATIVYDHGLSSASSRGRRKDDESEIAYAYGDGYSEFPSWTLVSKEDALAAAREFFQTGRRPTNLDWVDY
jgi:Immunity protein Imm1